MDFPRDLLQFLKRHKKFWFSSLSHRDTCIRRNRYSHPRLGIGVFNLHAFSRYLTRSCGVAVSAADCSVVVVEGFGGRFGGSCRLRR